MVRVLSNGQAETSSGVACCVATVWLDGWSGWVAWDLKLFYGYLKHISTSFDCADIVRCSIDKARVPR